jgi:hypothetical protein
MKHLGDLLGDLGQQFPDALAGKNSASGFDGLPLPETRQYRATLTRGEWRQNNSGKWQFSFTFEVTAPEEYAGRKFSEYYDAGKDAHPASREKLARLIGESGVPQDEIDQTDEGTFANSFVGAQYIIATRTWGTDNDRTGIRYLNRDRGQVLLDKIEPKKDKKTAAPLKADITVPKQEETDPAENIPAPAITLPKGPGGPNLPPGLRPQG